MKITIKKPSIKKPQLNKGKSLRNLPKFFYDPETFQKEHMPLSNIKLIILLIVFTTVTMITYFLTSYIRNTELSNLEILKQVAFLNYSLWVAFILFVTGINLLMVILFKIYKVTHKIRDFVLNQVVVALVMFLFMKIVATLLIVMDEKLPFEISLNYSFLRFNLLTILFVMQVLVVIVTTNYLLSNLPESMKKRKLVTFIVSVIYASSIWTLTAP